LHARRVRTILDDGGFRDITIFASGNLDEYRLRDLLAQGAAIEGFGVGTRMNTSADAPYLDCAYKMQEYEGRPRRKRSEGKATWPGRKQVHRVTASDGTFVRDVLAIDGEDAPGVPLLVPVMRGGECVSPLPALNASRNLLTRQLAALPAPLRALDDAPPYTVDVSSTLRALAAEIDAHT